MLVVSTDLWAKSRDLVRGQELETRTRNAEMDLRHPIHQAPSIVSDWPRSRSKRLFDCACILPITPLLILFFFLIAISVRLTSTGPILFRQKRMGRAGRLFTIVKFRTLEHRKGETHEIITTAANQRFTPVGPFLRRWKLDELPQLWNVLTGDMSLVGARPKLPKHQVDELQCRPGITGAATLAFAREERYLALLPEHYQLEEYYREKVLPLKKQLDSEYMARATFASDFALLIDTVLRRWDTSILESLLVESLFAENAVQTPVPKQKEGETLTENANLPREQQLAKA